MGVQYSKEVLHETTVAHVVRFVPVFVFAEPRPRIEILQPVSFSIRFWLFPRGPKIAPMKLY